MSTDRTTLVMIDPDTNASKFWTAELVGTAAYVTYGRIGTSGQEVPRGVPAVPPSPSGHEAAQSRRETTRDSPANAARPLDLLSWLVPFS